MHITGINYNLSTPKYHNFSKISSVNFSSKKDILEIIIDNWKKDKKFAWKFDRGNFFLNTYGIHDLSSIKKIISLYKNEPEKLKHLLIERGENGNLWSGANDVFYNGEEFYNIKNFLFKTAANLKDKTILKIAIMKPMKNVKETVFAYDYDYCKYSIPLVLQLVKQNKKAFSKQELEQILNDINNNKTFSKEFKDKANKYLK